MCLNFSKKLFCPKGLTTKDIKQMEMEEQNTTPPKSVTERLSVNFPEEAESEYHIMASNISFRMSVEETKGFFQQFGKLSYFKMPLSKSDPYRYPHGGKAFFGYKKQSSARAALTVNGTTVLGRELNVKVNLNHY